MLPELMLRGVTSSFWGFPCWPSAWHCASPYHGDCVLGGVAGPCAPRRGATEVSSSRRSSRCFASVRVLPSRQRMPTLQSMRDDASRGARSPKTHETLKTTRVSNPCAFGQWCAPRHCMVNGSNGTGIACLVAVVPSEPDTFFFRSHPGLLPWSVRSRMEVDRDEGKEELSFVPSAVSDTAGWHENRFFMCEKRCRKGGFKFCDIGAILVGDDGRPHATTSARIATVSD